MTAIAHTPRLGATILRTAARGAVLVGVAVVVGIVLYSVVNGSGGAGGGGARAGTTPSSSSASTGTTPTTSVNSGRPPAQVKVFVQNASGVSGAAATKANVLRGLGYAIVGTGNALTPQTGTVVGCKTAGFTKEADTLAKAVGVGTTVGAYPTPPPANSTSADCIVTIGK
jgi:LytR cell envelope-related transcriptional attenuator